MTRIHLAILGHEEMLSPFMIALANELGLAGLPADAGRTSPDGIWLGLWPQATDTWPLQTWAPDSLGPSVRLAADLHRGLRGWLRSVPQAVRPIQFADRGVGTVWPSVVPPPQSGTAEAIVTLPGPAALVDDRIVTAFAARLAKALAATLARHVGVAGHQLMTATRPVINAAVRAVKPEKAEYASVESTPDESETSGRSSPQRESAEQAHEPPTPVSEPDRAITDEAPASAKADTDNAPVTSTAAASAADEPPRPRSRSERIREGLQGSRTYEHPPWVTSEKLLPSPQPASTPPATVSPPSLTAPQPVTPPQSLAPPPPLP